MMGVRKITLERRMRSFGTSLPGKKVMSILQGQHSGYTALYMLSPSRQTYRETDVNVMHTCRSILIETTTSLCGEWC